MTRQEYLQKNIRSLTMAEQEELERLKSPQPETSETIGFSKTEETEDEEDA